MTWHHATWVYSDPRWQALRLAAKRRDGWKCVKCGSKAFLEIDHIQRIRDEPDRAFDLTNLQTLCRRCHSAKTARELGRGAPVRGRRSWLDLLRKMC